MRLIIEGQKTDSVHRESWHCMKTGSVAWQDKLSQLLDLWLYCMAFVSWCRPTYCAEVPHITVNHHVVGLHVGHYTYWPRHMGCVWWNDQWHTLSRLKWCGHWASCQLPLAYILYINKWAWLCGTAAQSILIYATIKLIKVPILCKIYSTNTF